MNTPQLRPRSIVVGVGHEGVGAALRFASMEARRLAAPIDLVHVLQVPAQLSAESYFPELRLDLERHAAQVLDDAERALRDEDPGLDVASQIRVRAGVVPGLVQAAERAGVLVLEHRRLGRLHRMVARSVVSGVCAHSTTSVVSVPEDWHPAGSGPVVVAIQDEGEAPFLLRAGAEHARALGVGLTVVHAWWFGQGYDPLLDDEMRHAWQERARTWMESALSGLGPELADLSVEVSVRHLRAADALIATSATASLLVLGRRHHLLPPGHRLGPVARAAVEHAACPALLVVAESGEPSSSTAEAHTHRVMGDAMS